MDATTLTLDSPLPDDVPTLQGLVRELLTEITRLRAELADVRGKLDAALKHRFGRRSERQPPAPRPKLTQPGRARPHGRASLPEHLERRDVIHDLTAAEQLCPCCGQPRRYIGSQTAEQLDLEPARFFVLRTIKKTYACQQCEAELPPSDQRVQTAGPAQVGPIPKGLCGPGLLAHVLVSKYADHLPLHRISRQLDRSGVLLSTSTLGDWVTQAVTLLEPLYDLMAERLQLSRVIHGDDTTVKLRVVNAHRTRKSHLWTYIGDPDYPYVLFDFTADYTADGPEAFLQGYKGYFQADALAQYNGLCGPQGAQRCGCWAHSRRKFVAAAEGGDERAQTPLAWIGELYRIEHELPPLLPPATDPVQAAQRQQREAERQRLRQLQARPFLTALKQWLDEQRSKVLPKSLLGQAIGYALNQWEELERYLERGYLAIDNNLSERTLRAIAVGRNNWGVFGSVAGGERAAVLYSMVATCQHQGIDPFSYLREALPGLFALGEEPTNEQLQAWLPEEWLTRRVQARAPTLAG